MSDLLSRTTPLMMQSGTGYSSMQEVPSCLAHPFCTDGSGTGFLVPCLQTDSCNRNTQLPKYPRGKQDTLHRDITFWRIQNFL